MTRRKTFVKFCDACGRDTRHRETGGPYPDRCLACPIRQEVEALVLDDDELDVEEVDA